MPILTITRANRRFVTVGGPGLGFLMTCLAITGCNDPYSQKRIQRRWEDFNATATDIQNREIDGYRRVNEAEQTAQKWWEQDCKQWEERAPTVGDYFW